MPRRLSRIVALSVVTSLIAVPVYACMWDYDTLAMEQQRFPNALELILGKFLRHSNEFYQWRIEDRKKKLERDPEDLRAYDDLAVAYDKTGQHDKAIETILAKDKIKPGLYETEANLGTFYIHAGQLEKGIEHIERAIEINPDAHFGREVYQKHLVNYVLSKQVDGKTKLPMGDLKGIRDRPRGFARYVLEVQQIPRQKPHERQVELQRALKGVMGMMRFGHHDSPILLEALGDLLLSTSVRSDAKRLAGRAYLKASYATEGEASAGYASMAGGSLSMQTDRTSTSQLKIGTLKATLRKEIAKADAWFAKVRADEIAWINAGKDVDAEFTDKYYQDPNVSSAMGDSWLEIGIGSGIAMIGLICMAAFVARRKRGGEAEPAAA